MCCPLWWSKASPSSWLPSIVTLLGLKASLIKWKQPQTVLHRSPSDHTSRFKALPCIFTPLEPQVTSAAAHTGLCADSLIRAACDLSHGRPPQGSRRQSQPPPLRSGCSVIQRRHGWWCGLPQLASVPHRWIFYRLHWLHWDRWEFLLVSYNFSPIFISNFAIKTRKRK